MNRAKRGERRSQSHRANPIALLLQFGGPNVLAYARCSDHP